MSPRYVGCVSVKGFVCSQLHLLCCYSEGAATPSCYSSSWGLLFVFKNTHYISFQTLNNLLHYSATASKAHLEGFKRLNCKLLCALGIATRRKFRCWIGAHCLCSRTTKDLRADTTVEKPARWTLFQPLVSVLAFVNCVNQSRQHVFEWDHCKNFQGIFSEQHAQSWTLWPWNKSSRNAKTVCRRG